MQRTREFNTQRLYGMGFIAIVASIILGIHCTYVFLIWMPGLSASENKGWLWCVSVVYHIAFVHLCMSFYKCIMTDPGIVPPNWGFYMGDETKRRRYCKMCNVWKPDRTHHCSVCNRCILNMDHHCPWINNCVGFYNRKFFIQLLGYVYITLLIVVSTSFMDIVNRIQTLFALPCWSCWLCSMDRWLILLKGVIVFMAYMMSVLLVCTLTNFIKFHLRLVLENYTTIENLEREEGAKSKFDIGRRRNWEQVFGQNPWLWWLTFHTQKSRPVGDGVRWRVHYTRVIDEDEEAPA
jgi:palmitoyltransferase